MRNGQWIPTVLYGHENIVCSVAISCNGRTIVSGSPYDIVRVWSMYNGHWTSIVLHGTESGMFSVAINADGRRIVCGNKTVCVWDMRNGHWEKSVDVLGFPRGVTVTSVNISERADIIKATGQESTWYPFDDRWWRLSNGSWRGSSEPDEGAVFGRCRFSPDRSALHALLSRAHEEEMQVVKNDLKMDGMACTADGFVFWGAVVPYIGFINITAV